MVAKSNNVRFGSLADIPSVSIYRTDFSSNVFYKPTPYWPVCSRIFLRACKTFVAGGSNTTANTLPCARAAVRVPGSPASTTDRLIENPTDVDTYQGRDAFALTTQKRKRDVWCPIMPTLAAEMATWERRPSPYLLQMARAKRKWLRWFCSGSSPDLFQSQLQERANRVRSVAHPVFKSEIINRNYLFVGDQYRQPFTRLLH